MALTIEFMDRCLVIITNFDIICVATNKSKTDAPLVIDRNGILSFAIAFKRM